MPGTTAAGTCTKCRMAHEVEGLEKTIREGVPEPKQYRSPMPPMGGASLTPEQVAAVAAYVWALSHP